MKLNPSSKIDMNSDALFQLKFQYSITTLLLNKTHKFWSPKRPNFPKEVKTEAHICILALLHGSFGSFLEILHFRIQLP